MARTIGDDYFNRLFPDQTQPTTPPRTPQSPAPAGEFEYKTVKVPGAKAYRSKHERALNRLAQEGWEVVSVQPRGVLQFGTKDTVTVRRKR